MAHLPNDPREPAKEPGQRRHDHSPASAYHLTTGQPPEGITRLALDTGKPVPALAAVKRIVEMVIRGARAPRGDRSGNCVQVGTASSVLHLRLESVLTNQGLVDDGRNVGFRAIRLKSGFGPRAALAPDDILSSKNEARAPRTPDCERCLGGRLQCA